MANNPKKYASDSTVSAIIAKIKELFVKKTDLETSLSNKADKSHTHSISDTTNLQSTLDAKVPTSRTINNKPLTANVTLSASDVGAAPSTHDHNSVYYTQSQVDSKLSGKSDTTHNHDNKYDTKGAAAAVQENLDTVSDALDDHTGNTDIHFTAAERTKLSNIQAGAQVNTITGVKGNSETSYRTGNVNITKANIGLGNVDNTSDANKPISTAQQLAFDEVNDAIDTHTENDDIHVTTTNKTNWNAAHTHSTSAHARTDATKVEDSSTNGNIKINGTETNVYSHPTSGVSAGTYKSVTVDAQGHITGGSNPTTLSGYGITDGASKSDVTNHNTSTSAHGDIRELITGLTTRLNTLANSDDTTLDQMSEIVAYIKSNKALIDSVTTNKVNVADIVNNLTTNVTNKPLSAAQGVEIKRLIDALQNELDTHKHSASDITSGTLSSDRLPTVPLTKGGTGATTAAGALTNLGITATAAELNKLDGVTATTTELNYVDGVTSNIQTQLNGKQATITGGASTIVSDDLTTNRVLISDNYGKVSASNISGGELSRLSGATKNIQEQIDDLDEAVGNKVSKYGDTMTGSLAIEPTSTTSPLISLIGNANASGQQAKSRFRKGTNSSVDNGTEVVDETFDGRKTSLILQSNKDLDKNRLRLKLTASDGTYEEYNLYGEHYKPTVADLGALENSSYDLHSFVTDRSVMHASNIVGDDVIPFVDVSLRSGRKITMTEFLKYISNNSGLASVATVTTAEYTALEQAQQTNANTLYMITDAEEEVIPTIQFITWEEND